MLKMNLTALATACRSKRKLYAEVLLFADYVAFV